MVRLFAFLTVLGFLSAAMLGCHAEAGVDPHGATSIIAPR